MLQTTNWVGHVVYQDDPDGQIVFFSGDHAYINEVFVDYNNAAGTEQRKMEKNGGVLCPGVDYEGLLE